MLIVLSLSEKVNEANFAEIKAVTNKPRTRLRPVALNTVEMIKLISTKLRINSH